MTKYSNTDFEIVKDIYCLIDKYGIDRICNTIDYISDIEKNKEIIIILKKINKLNSGTSEDKKFLNSIGEEDKKLYNDVIEKLNNKKIFSNINMVKNFVSSYGVHIKNSKTRAGVIEEFARSIIDFDNARKEKIMLELNELENNLISSKDAQVNELKNWASLIIDKE